MNAISPVLWDKEQEKKWDETIDKIDAIKSELDLEWAKIVELAYEHGRIRKSKKYKQAKQIKLQLVKMFHDFREVKFEGLGWEYLRAYYLRHDKFVGIILPLSGYIKGIHWNDEGWIK